MTNLFELINNSDYDFFFLVVDKFLDIKIPQLHNFYSIYDPSLKTKNSGFLLSQSKTQDFIKSVTQKSGHKAAIIPFKPSAKIDHICKINNWLVVSNPSPVNRLLEDKIKFYEICSNHNLPLVPSSISQFSEKDFIESQKKFGEKIVIQTHFGWAGNSSYLTSSYQLVKNEIEQGTTVKFSRFLNGYSLINNCCLTKNGLIQSPPGLQYTGIPGLTTNPLATVGRQWPCFAPKEIIDQVKVITSNFSSVLRQYGYRGFFGLDFIVNENKVYLLECNPRLTASFAFYTELEIRNNLNPQFLYHIAEFIGINTEAQDTFYSEIIGSEITLKNDVGATTRKFNDFIAFSGSCDPVSIDQSILTKVI